MIEYSLSVGRGGIIQPSYLTQRQFVPDLIW
jgi:hypothetical protein